MVAKVIKYVGSIGVPHVQKLIGRGVVMPAVIFATLAG